MFDGRFRSGVDRVVKPVGSALERTGLSPDHVTALALVLALTTAWAIATGRLGLGLGLLITSAVLDVLDGAVAKASGRSSMRGAFFDSVCDRVGRHAGARRRGLVHARSLPRPHRAPAHGRAGGLVPGVLRASQGRVAGILGQGRADGAGGAIVVLCAGLAFSFVMVPLLWFMLALTTLTAVQRFVMVWRQANGAGYGPPPAERPGVRSPRGRRPRTIRPGVAGNVGPLAGLAGGQRLGAACRPVCGRLSPDRRHRPLAGAPSGPHRPHEPVQR